MLRGAFTQIVFLVLAIGIIVTNVHPQFLRVGELQDTTETYRQELTKVSDVNTELERRIRVMESIAEVDSERLQNYLPDTVDPIQVQRDLVLITRESGALYVEASAGDEFDMSAFFGADVDSATLPLGQEFSLQVEGTYQQVKRLLTLLEQNHYPLHVYDLAISPVEGGFLSLDLILVTYAYQPLETE
jgi:hypothetical protein